MLRTIIISSCFIPTALLAQNYSAMNGDSTSYNFTDANDLKQGYWQEIQQAKDPNNILVDRGYYVNSERSGSWAKFRKGDLLLQTMHYDSGKHLDTLRIYYPTGELQIEERYKDGELKWYSQYYKNKQRQFSLNLTSHSWNFWDEQGKDIFDTINLILNYEAEARYKVMAANGVANRRDSLNRKQGLWVMNAEQLKFEDYNKDAVVQLGMYKDDIKQGVWLFYYSNRKLKNLITFKNGKPDGRTIFFYKTGKLNEMGIAKRNMWQSGLYLLFWNNGNVRMERRLKWTRGTGKYHREWTEEGVIENEFIEEVNAFDPNN